VLPADHPTIAREQVPEARLADPKFAASAEVFPVLTSLARTLRTKQYSIRTEQTYVDWGHRFLRYCKGKPVETLGPVEVDAFLTHLAVECSVAPSTQSVALNALVFLFNEVLGRPLDGLKFSRAKRRERVPVVLTRAEVEHLLGCMEGTYGLIAGLLYGTGMRLLEGLRLRVGDLDFGHESIVVRNGKGDKDRVVPLPKRYRSPLVEHLEEVEALHRADLAAGAGTVYLPYALARKYPNAPREWIWQYVFPSVQLSRELR
jgi:integron integrase